MDDAWDSSLLRELDLPDLPAVKARASVDEFQVDPRETAQINRRERPSNFDIIHCPECSGKVGVRESRRHDGYGPAIMRRVRRCTDCGFSLTTVEINSIAFLDLIRCRDESSASRIAAHLRALAVLLEGSR